MLDATVYVFVRLRDEGYHIWKNGKWSQKYLFNFHYLIWFYIVLLWLQETVDSELSHDQVDDDDINAYIDNMLAKSVAELVSMIQEHAELSLIDNYVMLRVQLVVA